MNMKQYETLIIGALRELGEAAQNISQEIYPIVPLPRSKTFIFTPRVTWPLFYDSCVYFTECGLSDRRFYNISSYSTSICEAIMKDCKYQPSKILRALRNIQAATAWCEARTEGRKRAAEEILRQQSRAVEILEAEATLQALK